MKNKKLIIHEINDEGKGYATYNGETHYYTYDGGVGDIKTVVQKLIEMGFIESEDVVILEQDEIYNIVEQYYNREG